jgi:Skp family chaperone for outer membrane proteins
MPPLRDVPSRLPAQGSSLLLALFFMLGLAGCQSIYYNTLEKFGIEKRDIMVDRVESARDAQANAQETFRSSLERFQSVVGKPDTELQEKYDEISSAYDDSKASAEDVNERIEEVEDVAEALFDEWEDELDRYSDDRLRRDSERKLEQTRRRYDSLITAMHNAAERMEPVLEAFEDQVLYLKHNLNAQSIQGMRGELDRIEQDVDALIRQMQESIAESERFIEGLD